MESNYEKEMTRRNEKIPDPQNCFGVAAINQYPQIVLGGGGGVARNNWYYAMLRP